MYFCKWDLCKQKISFQTVPISSAELLHYQKVFIIPSPTTQSAVREPKARAGEGTNLDMRGILLHAWWLGRKNFAVFTVYI